MQNNSQLQTPVAFIVFNRPDTTRRVFEQIRKARPTKLLVVADGPRAHVDDEKLRCKKARAVIEEVDWECEVLTNFADENLGCRKRVSSGLDWVFEQVEKAIVLEDDCLPHPDFFRFCSAMLDRFRNDQRITMITGTNHLLEWKAGRQSYHYSYHGPVWGWASWRRAWRHYDVGMKTWQDPEAKRAVRAVIGEARAFEEVRKQYEATFQGEIDTWDYQWRFAQDLQSGLCVTPSRNLISNIGFGQNATHTTTSDSQRANLPVSSLAFPLRHNPFVVCDRDYDATVFAMYRDSLAKYKRLVPSPIKRLLKRYSGIFRNPPL